jgi:hypothetical protein
METPYNGCDFCLVNALADDVWQVKTNRGVLIGTYPNARIAIRVAKTTEKILLRDYLKALRKGKA